MIPGPHRAGESSELELCLEPHGPTFYDRAHDLQPAFSGSPASGLWADIMGSVSAGGCSGIVDPGGSVEMLGGKVSAEARVLRKACS
jgi:hypothetical protein